MALRLRFVCAMYDDRFCGKLSPPSIHPNLWLCNCSAKHGAIEAHRLGELPSTVEPYAYGHKCRFYEAFLVIPVVGLSGWHLERQNWVDINDPDPSEHRTWVRLASSRTEGISCNILIGLRLNQPRKKERTPWLAHMCNKCVHSLGCTICFRIISKFQVDLYSVLQFLLLETRGRVR